MKFVTVARVSVKKVVSLSSGRIGEFSGLLVFQQHSSPEHIHGMVLVTRKYFARCDGSGSSVVKWKFYTEHDNMRIFKSVIRRICIKYRRCIVWCALFDPQCSSLMHNESSGLTQLYCSVCLT